MPKKEDFINSIQQSQKSQGGTQQFSGWEQFLQRQELRVAENRKKLEELVVRLGFREGMEALLELTNGKEIREERPSGDFNYYLVLDRHKGKAVIGYKKGKENRWWHGPSEVDWYGTGNYSSVPGGWSYSYEQIPIIEPTERELEDTFSLRVSFSQDSSDEHTVKGKLRIVPDLEMWKLNEGKGGYVRGTLEQDIRNACNLDWNIDIGYMIDDGYEIRETQWLFNKYYTFIERVQRREPFLLDFGIPNLGDLSHQ
ncbi:hypothetical protein HYV22_03670 [Candidatus Gottesmanbacteria bacterium]|nr:hypothetical protein [Candidatus Gottesmanbacteria bacterium]